MAGGGARKCAGSLQRGGSRKRTLKSLILEEEVTRERERQRVRGQTDGGGGGREGGEIRTPPNLCADSRTELRVSRVRFSFGYTLSDNAIVETIRG